MESAEDAARVALALADDAFDQGEWRVAIDRYLEVSAEAAGATNPTVMKLRVRALRSAGAASYNAGDLEGASEHLLAAQRQCEALGDLFELAEVNQRLGHLRRGQGDYAEALRLAEAAHATFVRVANRLAEAQALFDMARANLLLGHYDAALRAADSVVKILGPRGASSRLAEAHRVAGDVLFAYRRYDEADGRYRRALDVATELDDRVTSRGALRGIALVALALHNSSAAESALRERLRYSESPVVAGSREEDQMVAEALEGLSVTIAELS